MWLPASPLVSPSDPATLRRDPLPEREFGLLDLQATAAGGELVTIGYLTTPGCATVRGIDPKAFASQGAQTESLEFLDRMAGRLERAQ